MRITLELGDILLTLALTVVVTVAFAASPPFWLGWVKTKWSERSRRSAQRRIEKLQARLVLLAEIKSDPTRRLARATALSSNRTACVVHMLGMLICGLLFTAIFGIARLLIAGGIPEQPIDLSTIRWQYRVLTSVMLAAYLAGSYLFLRFHILLQRYTQTEYLIGLTEKQIEKLQKRLLAPLLY